MNQKMYKWRYLSFTFLVLLLTACIIVPTGSEVKSSDISNFRPGFTTKYEVLEKLGEPNILNEDRFSVYQLSEDTYSMFIYIVIGGGHKHWAGEIYNLTISYDARDVVKEIRYSKTAHRSDADLVTLEERFSDRSVDFAKNDSYYTMDISADGSWITAVSSDRFVFHEIGGEHKEIENEGREHLSSSASINCLTELQTTHAQKLNVEYEWIFDNEDIKPFYRMCKPFGMLDTSEDGNLVAVAHKKELELWSLERGGVQARILENTPISGVSFNSEQNSLVTFGNKLEINFVGPSSHSISLNMRSSPQLDVVASIERKYPPIRATAFSNDGQFFALATNTHIELWERKEINGTESNFTWPYKLKRLMPKPSGYDVTDGGFRFQDASVPEGVLRFSTDGQYLMNVDTLLHVWGVHSGRLLARIGSEVGFINAAFYKDKEIIAIRGVQNRGSWSPPFIPRYKAIKLWRLPLNAVISQYDDVNNPGIVPVSNLGLQPSGGIETNATGGNSKAELSGKTDGNATPLLTPAYWRALLAGNTATGKSEKGKIFHVYHAPNGAMEGRVGSSWDSGTWEITEDDRFCSRWKKWRNGSRDCFSMYQLGDNKFRFKAIYKTYESIFAIREGDPEKLGKETTEIFQLTSSITGTYSSEITGNWSLALGVDGPTTEVKLVQNGNEITGSFGHKGGKIFGQLEGNVVKFKWLGLGTRSGSGKWVFKPEDNEINGSWHTDHGNDMSGKWNLKGAPKQPGFEGQKTTVDIPPPKFDLSGVYTSKIFRKNSSNYFCFNQKRTFMIELKQEDNRIKGMFMSGITGNIEGTIVNNSVKFTWFTTKCNGHKGACPALTDS